jgi:hypothetical protein
MAAGVMILSNNIEGKVAVITGVSSGLGEATAMSVNEIPFRPMRREY